MNETKLKAQSIKRGTRKANRESQRNGDLTIDTRARRVWVGEQEIRLTKLEYGVLEYLARREGRVVTYQELWREVWKHFSPLDDGEQRAVRQAVKRLRTKLSDNRDTPHFLTCVRDVGFRFEKPVVEIDS